MLRSKETALVIWRSKCFDKSGDERCLTRPLHILLACNRSLFLGEMYIYQKIVTFSVSKCRETG